MCFGEELIGRGLCPFVNTCADLPFMRYTFETNVSLGPVAIFLFSLNRVTVICYPGCEINYFVAFR